jgi:hypothetical protein
MARRNAKEGSIRTSIDICSEAGGIGFSEYILNIDRPLIHCFYPFID